MRLGWGWERTWTCNNKSGIVDFLIITCFMKQSKPKHPPLNTHRCCERSYMMRTKRNPLEGAQERNAEDLWTCRLAKIYVIHQNYLALLFVANKIEKWEFMKRKTQKYPPNPKIAPYNERLLEEKSIYPMVHFCIAQSGRNIKRYPKNEKIPKNILSDGTKFTQQEQ